MIVALLSASDLFGQPPIVREALSLQVDGFAVANGIRLHYVDWGGGGQTLLFLPGLGDSVHQFDGLAPEFTDRFHALGLDRRGQGESDKPPSGYDTDTLATDIRAFLDTLRIDRAVLIGHSIAGAEMTRFAALYPDRLAKLVYLDAAYDNARGHERAAAANFPLPVSKDDAVVAAIDKGASAVQPDYTTITVPALAFFVIYGQTVCHRAHGRRDEALVRGCISPL